MEIILTLLGIFLFPIFGFFLSRFITIGIKQIRKGFYVLIFGVILLTFFWLIKLHFDYNVIYYYLTLTAYLFYCFFVFSIKIQKDYKYKNTLFVMSLVPIIVIYIVGLIMLPLAGFLSWGLQDTYKTQDLGDNYNFSIKYSGNVSSEWTDLEVNKKYSLIPFMHKEIFNTSINSERMDKSKVTIDFKNSPANYKIRISENENLIIDTLINK